MLDASVGAIALSNVRIGDQEATTRVTYATEAASGCANLRAGTCKPVTFLGWNETSPACPRVTFSRRATSTTGIWFISRTLLGLRWASTESEGRTRGLAGAAPTPTRHWPRGSLQRGSGHSRTLKSATTRGRASLVFVEQWLDPSDFSGGRLSPDQMVPKTLYMPDGRMAPVCVVRITRSAPDFSILPAWHWPEHLIGGGFPIISESQNARSIASVGMLVTDGHLVYALTSRHVTGPQGHAVSTVLRGHCRQIGVSSERRLTRLQFSVCLPRLPRSANISDVGRGTSLQSPISTTGHLRFTVCRLWGG